MHCHFPHVPNEKNELAARYDSSGLQEPATWIPAVGEVTSENRTVIYTSKVAGIFHPPPIWHEQVRCLWPTTSPFCFVFVFVFFNYWYAKSGPSSRAGWHAMHAHCFTCDKLGPAPHWATSSCALLVRARTWPHKS